MKLLAPLFLLCSSCAEKEVVFYNGRMMDCYIFSKENGFYSLDCEKEGYYRNIRHFQILRTLSR